MHFCLLLNKFFRTSYIVVTNKKQRFNNREGDVHEAIIEFNELPFKKKKE